MSAIDPTATLRVRSLPPGTADRVRLLVEDTLGPGYWDGFQAYMTEPLPWHEWRFGGKLGLGGKLNLHAGRLYVTCYPEDETPIRRAAIARVNSELAAVLDECVSPPPPRCPECKGTGAVTDMNGNAWRCRYCHGTGRK